MSFVKEIVAIEEEQLQLMSIDVIVEHIGSHLSRSLVHRPTPERRLELIYWIITNWRLSSISQNAIRWMCKRPDHNMIIGHNYIIIIIMPSRDKWTWRRCSCVTWNPFYFIICSLSNHSLCPPVSLSHLSLITSSIPLRMDCNPVSELSC